MMLRNIYRYFFLCFIISLVFLTSCEKHRIGIKKGENFLSKELFIRNHFPISIWTIQVGNFDSFPDKEIIIFSKDSCLILDSKTKKIINVIKFKEDIGMRPEILHIRNNNSLAIMLRGGGFDDVGLLDLKGKFIWKYKKAGTSPYMAAGDLDRDGSLEFYVADDDGLHKLDQFGKEIWKTGTSFSEVQIYEPKGNKTPLIVTTGDVVIKEGDRQKIHAGVNFIDNAGQIIRKFMPKANIYELELIDWPDDFHILTKDSNQIIVMDFYGQVIFSYDLEKDFQIINIRGIPVKLNTNEKPYLAVITRFSTTIKKSMLSIFSPEKKLVYQEMLNATTGITTLENIDGSEGILAGDGIENVWLYKLKKE